MALPLLFLKDPHVSLPLLQYGYQSCLPMARKPYSDVSVSPGECSYIPVEDHQSSHKNKDAEHFLEKPRLTWAISEFVNLHLLADPTYPRNPKTFGQKLRKKRMDLELQIKELARLVHVTSDTIINWELRNIKPNKTNSRRAKKFLELQGAK